MATTTKTYYAKSIWTSTSFLFNAIAAIVAIIAAVLDAKEVIDILPQNWIPYLTAAVSIGNIVIRVFTFRPVAFVAPGNTKPIKVKALHARHTTSE